MLFSLYKEEELKTYEVNVIVGLAPSAKKIVTTKDIERLFQESEQLFLKVSNIKARFLIQEIYDWDPQKLANDKQFKEFCDKHPPQFLNDYTFLEAHDLTVSLYYTLGNFDTDIFVGFINELLAKGIKDDVCGYFIRPFKSCVCSLKIDPDIWPIILTHEIMHILKACDELEDKQSLMYIAAAGEVLKRPELKNQFVLDGRNKNRLKQCLEKIYLNRFK